VVAGGLLAAASTSTVDAKSRQEVRFYKVNKDGISQRLRFTTKKSRRAGCHNLIKKARIHKVSHFGYAYCEVFQSSDCLEESKMQFAHDKVEESQTQLSQGYGWQPIGEHERGEKMKSWRCVAEPQN